MDNINIREANSADCENIIQLIEELAVFENEPTTVVRVTPEVLKRDGFSDDGSNKWFTTLIAEEESEIIGFIFFYKTYSTWKGRAMKVEDLFVKQLYRNRGVGTRLLKEVTKVALSVDCARLHWNVLEWNDDAVRLYKRVGADVDSEWSICKLNRESMQKFVE